MTRQEFGQWLNRLKNAFPAVDRFFDRGSDDDAAALFTLWLDVLHVVAVSDADRAIGALAAGDLTPPTYPDDWARLPAMVRRWCRENLTVDTLPARYSDPQSYRCLACHDRGYGVEVFNPEWVSRHESAIEAGLTGLWFVEARRWCRQRGCGPLVYGCDCNCERGRELHEKRKPPERQAYNSREHCLVPGGGPRYWADALATWVAEHPVIANREWVPQVSYSEVTEQ